MRDAPHSLFDHSRAGEGETCIPQACQLEHKAGIYLGPRGRTSVGYDAGTRNVVGVGGISAEAIARDTGAVLRALYSTIDSPFSISSTLHLMAATG